MRVESSILPQLQVESHKIVENKGINSTRISQADFRSHPSFFVPSPFGTTGVYSLSSLRAAVGYNAKFLTVAQSNIEAVNHPSGIPDLILNRLRGAG